jgi:hypothetical protein
MTGELASDIKLHVALSFGMIGPPVNELIEGWLLRRRFYMYLSGFISLRVAM